MAFQSRTDLEKTHPVSSKNNLCSTRLFGPCLGLYSKPSTPLPPGRSHLAGSGTPTNRFLEVSASRTVDKQPLGTERGNETKRPKWRIPPAAASVPCVQSVKVQKARPGAPQCKLTLGIPGFARLAPSPRVCPGPTGGHSGVGRGRSGRGSSLHSAGGEAGVLSWVHRD